MKIISKIKRNIIEILIVIIIIVTFAWINLVQVPVKERYINCISDYAEKYCESINTSFITINSLSNDFRKFNCNVPYNIRTRYNTENGLFFLTDEEITKCYENTR